MHGFNLVQRLTLPFDVEMPDMRHQAVSVERYFLSATVCLRMTGDTELS